MTVAVPTDHDSAQEHFAKLRAWVVDHCHDGEPIRQSARSMALSANIHRLLKYGPDESLNRMSARELMCLLIFTNGRIAEYLMRTAYTRAIIEGDHDIYEYLNTTLFIPEVRAWYFRLVEALLGKAPNPEDVTHWVETMQGEELCVARLIISRVYPDLAHYDWLHDVPENLPRLAAELCLILLSNRAYKTVVQKYLREHPTVRYSIPDSRWTL